MDEVWKKVDWIKGLKSDYEVSSLGRIRCIGGVHHTFNGDRYVECERYLKPHLNRNGYCYVNLYPNSKQAHYYIHRIVADAFLDKEEGKDFINHKNEIKTDNRAENLERCTRQYNNQYSSHKLYIPSAGKRSNEYGRNIHKHKDGKFEVNCYHAGKSKYIGRFAVLEEARKARNDYFDSLGLLGYLTDEEKECKA